MLYDTPVKVHLYLKVYFLHTFLSYYNSLSMCKGEDFCMWLVAFGRGCSRWQTAL